jgi:Rrf2 family protein
VRGPKGGHVLTRPPEEITLGEIVALLEDGTSLVECSDHAGACQRADSCPTRLIWKEASEAMFERLHAITLADLVNKAQAMNSKEFDHVF